MNRHILLVPLLLLAAPTTAHAMHWSLGANLGLTVISPTEDGSESVTVFGWPSSSFINIVGVPGMRVGFMGDDPRHQFYLDTGLANFSTDGASLRMIQMHANYQYNFANGRSTFPYLTGGLGVTSISSDDFFGDFGASGILFGAGIGVQHRIGHGHGTVRAEVRFDHQSEGEDDGFPILPESNNVGLKLGFDLWMN